MPMIRPMFAAAALLCAGCYMSSGGRFAGDVDTDASHEVFPVEDVTPGDDGGDAEEIVPPACDEAPLLVPTSVVTVGDSSPRTTGSAFYDPLRDRVIVAGGLRGSGDYTPEAVAIYPATGRITLLGYEGTAPVGWTWAGTAHDPFGDRIFVAGGVVRGDFSSRVLVLRGAGDDRLAASELPSLPQPVRSAAAGYDPVGGRLVVFGGYDGTGGGGTSRRTLVLHPDEPGPGWLEMTDAGGPVAQEDALMLHVPDYGLVMLAASTENYAGVRVLYVMKTASSSWEEITLDPAWTPGNRPAFFWDDEACRLIVWGGGCTEGARSIDLFASPAWVVEIPLDLPGYVPRVFLNATLDPVRRQVVVQGGYDCGVYTFLEPVDFIRFD